VAGLVEAMNDAEIREDVARVLGGVDDALTARIAAAQEAGELDADADPKVLGTIAGAILHSLAVRARAGASRRSLEDEITVRVDDGSVRTYTRNAATYHVGERVRLNDGQLAAPVQPSQPTQTMGG